MKGLRKILSTDNIIIFVYTYALTKYFLKSKNGLINVFIILLRIIITIPSALLIYAALLIFACFYDFLNIILSIKHGANFKGLLEGMDTMWNVESKSKNMICVLFILDAKPNESCDVLYQFACDKYAKLSITHEKLRCLRKRILGFYYLLQTEIHIEEFVKYMDDYNDETELSILLDKYSNSLLPIENQALWEVYIGKTPIKWKRNYGNLQYPVFIKYHHCVGDGMSFITMMMTNLMKDGLDIMKTKCDTYKKILESKFKKNYDKSIISKCKEVLNKKLYIKYCGIFESKENNLLHGNSLSGEKHVCWGLENENSGYVAKVKAIKNRFEDYTFNDVIMTAVSASFSEYYTQHNLSLPLTIRCGLTYYMSFFDFNKLVTIKDDDVVAKLTNNFAIGIVDLPISEHKIASNLLDQLHAVKKNHELLKKSLDFWFFLWQSKVGTVVPLSIGKYWIKPNENTLALTNVPGINTLNTLSDHTVRDVVIWAPNYLKTGITLSVFTFDDLFRFGLLVDKAIIEDRKEVQTILDNVFKYIDILDQVTSDIKL